MNAGASVRTKGARREIRRAEPEPRRRTGRTRRSPVGSPPLSAADARIIEAFIDLSWMERGLAAATLSAYGSDLSYFSRWLASRGLELGGARRHDVLEFHHRSRALAAAINRAAAVGAASVLPVPGTGRTDQGQPLRSNRCAEARTPAAQRSVRTRRGAAARSARGRHRARAAGPRDAGGAIRDGASRIGARGVGHRAGEPAPGRRAGRGKG